MPRGPRATSVLVTQAASATPQRPRRRAPAQALGEELADDAAPARRRAPPGSRSPPRRDGGARPAAGSPRWRRRSAARSRPPRAGSAAACAVSPSDLLLQRLDASWSRSSSRWPPDTRGEPAADHVRLRLRLPQRHPRRQPADAGEEDRAALRRLPAVNTAGTQTSAVDGELERPAAGCRPPCTAGRRGVMVRPIRPGSPPKRRRQSCSESTATRGAARWSSPAAKVRPRAAGCRPP